MRWTVSASVVAAAAATSDASALAAAVGQEPSSAAAGAAAACWRLSFLACRTEERRGAPGDVGCRIPDVGSWGVRERRPIGSTALSSVGKNNVGW